MYVDRFHPRCSRILVLSSLLSFLGTQIIFAQNTASPVSDEKLLVSHGKRSGEGYYNQAADRIVFQSEVGDENPFYQIFWQELSSGVVRRISPGIGKTTCAWFHPVQPKILFSSTHMDPQALQKAQDEIEARKNGSPRNYAWDYDPMYDIFEQQNLNQNDGDPGSLIHLTNEYGYDAEASYSPDGTKILYASNAHTYARFTSLTEEQRIAFTKNPSLGIDLFEIDLKDNSKKQLTFEWGYDGGPFYSQDGSTITWRKFHTTQNSAEIWIMNTQGFEAKLLTQLNRISWAPFIHPSLEYVIFSSQVGNGRNFDLFLVDLAGVKEPVQITFEEGFDGLASFDVSGSKLTWTTQKFGSTQIAEANWNHDLALSLISSSPNRLNHEITEEDLYSHVSHLASSKLEGRETGSKGEALAASYIKSWFQSIKLDPAKDFALSDYIWRFTTNDSRVGRNVIASLQPKNPEYVNNPAILVGAHYDHLGKMNEKIYLGADDNASGTAAVLELAQKLKFLVDTDTIELKHPILFAAWSGEEIGLIGSSAFAKFIETTFQNPSKKIMAVFNLDMVGRLEENLVMGGTGSSSVWKNLIEDNIRLYPKLKIVQNEDPYLPTDSTAFYLQNIPGISFFTGAHEDYHQATDSYEKLNYEGLKSITALSLDMILALDSLYETIDYVSFPAPTGGSRLRVYFGTIPDYASSDVGVKLSGVKAQSPADIAGLKKGDVILALGGIEVKNIQDYTNAMAILEAGIEYSIKIKRGGEILLLAITPTKRS